MNQAPVVDAGVDQTIDIAGNPQVQTAIAGTASDDGLPNPPAQLTTTWSKVSGPGTVTFGNANALSTTATFTASGIYVLRLTGSDSALQSTDDITVTVNDSTLGGSISGSQTISPASLNLTAEGTSDWAHWGLGESATAFNHKTTGGTQISNFTRIGPAATQGSRVPQHI